MNEHIPALIPAVGEEPADTIMRGAKMRIFPSPRQVKIMDLWRRRCIQLWNLLLGMEQAAYSGENVKTQLGWRSIWATVVQESHAEAIRVAREGKMRKDGTFRKEPGVRQEPPPLDEAMLAKIRRQMDGAVDVDPDTGEVRPAQPRLFMWEHELQKIMARLKQVPRTEWIGDLPSHAAQTVVKDLIKALQAMLREKKKRAAGAGGRDTGFPKFKKQRYAAGSVYFANTQLKFEITDDGCRVKLPNGVGLMRCHLRSDIAEKLRYAEAKLMGGRIWRQGEDWYLSCQFKMPKPAALPPTGQVAAIKLAASIPVTVHALGRDGHWRTREYEMPPIDKDLLAAHKAAGRAQSRTLEAAKKRKKDKSAYRERRHRQKLEKGLKANPPKVGMKLSPAFYAHAAKLAALEARDANVRDAWLHELTTTFVRDYEVIATQRLEVAKMMEKPEPPEEKEDQVKPEWQRKRRSLKAVRVMMRRSMPARFEATLAYKAVDLRGPQAHERIPPQHVTAGACSGCGVLHPEFKEQRARGKTIIRCREPLADGRACNTVLHYTRNSARVMGRDLQQRLEARAERKG